MIGCFVGFTKVKSHPASCSFYLHGPLDTVNSDVSMACLSVNTMLSNDEPHVNVLFYWISQKKPSKITCTARHETIIVAPRIHDRF